MSKRIQCHTALVSGGRVAKFVGGPGVGEFMKGQRGENRDTVDHIPIKVLCETDRHRQSSFPVCRF